MSDFLSFCRAHGLLLDHVVAGKWVRTPTESHPRSKNGSYKYLGDVGFCQEFATMPEPATWFPDKDSEIKIDRAAIQKMRFAAEKKLAADRIRAAKKAEFILSESTYEQHAYLDSKGFPNMTGLIYRPSETENLLVIPMRVGDQLVGCQLVDREGTKKFLYGQRCAGAEFVLGNGVMHWFVEGYATGLSLMACLTAIRAPSTVHVCFSAGNMQAMAKAAGRGCVVADNDASETGLKAAIATGLPFYMPLDIGADFNDAHKALGTFKASQILREFLQRTKRETKAVLA